MRRCCQNYVFVNGGNEKKKRNKAALLQINFTVIVINLQSVSQSRLQPAESKTHSLERQGRGGPAQPPPPPDENGLIMGWHLHLSEPLVEGGEKEHKKREKKVCNWRVSKSDQSVPSVEGGPLICIYRPETLHRLMI